jgi:hypothetical protein
MTKGNNKRRITGAMIACLLFFSVSQTVLADTAEVAWGKSFKNDGIALERRINLSKDAKVKEPSNRAKRRKAKGAAKGAFYDIRDISYWNRFSSRYYYQDLTEDEKKFYDAYCESLNEFLSSDIDAYQIQSVDENDQPATLYTTRMVNVPESVSNERVDEIATLLEYENPQFFFHFSYAAHVSGTGDQKVDYVYPVVLDEFREGGVRMEAAYQIMELVEDYLAEAKAGKSILEKESIVRKEIIEYVHYQYDENGETNWENLYQTSASAILYGATVCAGYTKMFAMLRNALQVPTISVTSLSHAWNEIQMDGKWYNVDITWDDKDKNTDLDATQVSQSRNRYFNISDNTLRQRDDFSYRTGYYMHTPENFYTLRPACLKDYAVPKPVTCKLKKTGSGKMKITASAGGQIQGYQIFYKVGTKTKTIEAASTGALSRTVGKLKKGKTVKVRLRAYLVIQGQKVYSVWTSYKKVKV